MAFELNLGAIRSAAKKHAATPGDMATAATLATKPAQSVATVATVATVASRHGLERLLTNAANDPTPDPRKPESERRVVTLAPDPGAPRLLAMAMAFCDRTGASDKARAQWQQDAADTPPELRGDLYQYLLSQTPPALVAPAPARPAPAPKPMGWLHMDQPWRAADRLYESHHGQCPVCKATSTGHSDRCAAGQHLHLDYTQAAMAAMNGINT